jgi:D-3-phosphoglycerate dehydrogenase
MIQRRKILLLEPIYCEALIALKNRFEVIVEILPNKEKLIEVIKDKEVLILRSRIKLDKEVIGAAKNLKLVAVAGMGVDNICLEELKNRGITWFNVPYISARDVAEFTFGLILSLSRRICLADSLLRKNQWKKSELIGTSLEDKIFGIVGYGEIGQKIGSLAKCLGMNVQVYTKHAQNKTFESNITPVSLEKLLRTCDIISIHVPLTEETRGMFSRTELEMMKETALLINTSRGGIINEEDLYHALKDRTIGGAAVDVFENERQYSKLFELDNVVLTPHIAAMTQEAQEKIGVEIVEKITDFFGSEK